MTIISRYILREFSKSFFYGLAVAASLFFIIELFERLDTFIKHHASFNIIVKYFFYKLPSIVFTITPVAVLLATFITLGILARNFEIVAFRATGISLFRLVLPILAYTLTVSIISLLGNELLTPYTNRKVKTLYNEIKGRKQKFLFKQHQLWYRGEDVIYNINLFSRQYNILRDVTLYFFDSNFHLCKRIDAERAQWKNNQWVFANVTTRFFDPEQKNKTLFKRQKVLPLKENPETFKQEVREPKEMSYVELKEYIEKTTQEGYDTKKYLADLYAKGSTPFINFIIALLGIPFAISIGRHGGFALGVTLSFVVGFFYWVFFNMCLALGYSGALPPIISAWIANFIFGTFGLWMLLHIRY